MHMKKYLQLLPLLAIVFSACSTLSEKKFTVNGSVQGLKATLVYLEEVPMATLQRKVVDSVQPSSDGSFVLKAKAAEETVFNIRVNQQEYPAASLVNDVNKVELQLFFNPAQPQFTDRYVVKGSVASEALQAYMLAFNRQLQKVFAWTKQRDSLQQAAVARAASIDTLNQSIQKQAAALRLLTEKALELSKSPALSMMILGYYQSMAGNPAFGIAGFSMDEIKAEVKKLTSAYPSHKGLEAVNIMLTAQPSSTQGLVGQTAPEFSLPDPAGKQISLRSFRGRYVLVDFWASWCKPCRMENPNVVAAYAKFKNRNFTILGVSLDQEGKKEDWLKAVMQDRLTWTQVSDLQFWNSAVVPLYNIQGIPFNVLVDPSGKIIAESLRGEQLATTLEQVLPK